MIPIISFLKAFNKRFLPALLAALLLSQLFGCAQSVQRDLSVHSNKHPSLTEDHQSLGSGFKEKIASYLDNQASLNEGLDSQATPQAQKFEVVRTFAAASGEPCCLVRFRSPAEEALFCQKHNGDIVRVRFLNKAHE